MFDGKGVGGFRGLHDTRVPISFCWGNLVWFLQIVVDPPKDAGKPASLDCENHTGLSGGVYAALWPPQFG